MAFTKTKMLPKVALVAFTTDFPYKIKATVPDKPNMYP